MTKVARTRTRVSGKHFPRRYQRNTGRRSYQPRAAPVLCGLHHTYEHAA